MSNKFKQLFKLTKVHKYILAGGTTFVFEYGVYLALVYVLSVSSVWAQAISYTAALFVNFSLLRLWAFSHGKGNLFNNLSKYGLLVVFNLPASSLLIWWFGQIGLAPFVAKFLVVAAVAVWNYFVYDKIIFRNQPVDQTI